MNRTSKGDRDAADWVPNRHGAWFAQQVIAVKVEYSLSVDPDERDALKVLLAGGGAQLNCLAADPGEPESPDSPTATISSSATAPVTGAFSVAVTFSAPVQGFEVSDLVVVNGTASSLEGRGASYAAVITPAASGTVTVEIPAGAVHDADGRPNRAALQFSIIADLSPVPALPFVGVVGLMLMLAAGGAKSRLKHVRCT